MYGLAKSAENLKKLLKEDKERLEQLNCEVLGFNRDNETKMRNLGDDFADEEKIDDFGCPTHVVDLVIKGWYDFHGDITDCKTKSNKILSNVKNSKTKHFLKEKAGMFCKSNIIIIIYYFCLILIFFDVIKFFFFFFFFFLT